MKLRKVHRFGVRGQGARSEAFRWQRATTVSRLQHRTMCGLNVDAMTIAIHDAAFRWLPRHSQCESCSNGKPRLGFPWFATAEMQTTVETIAISYALTIVYLNETEVEPHQHVWLPYVSGVDGVDPKLNPWRCTCGAFSRDGKTANGSESAFAGIHRSVAPSKLAGSVLDPNPDPADVQRAVEDMQRLLEESGGFEWRRAGRCGGAID